MAETILAEVACILHCQEDCLCGPAGNDERCRFWQRVAGAPEDKDAEILRLQSLVEDIQCTVNLVGNPALAKEVARLINKSNARKAPGKENA